MPDQHAKRSQRLQPGHPRRRFARQWIVFSSLIAAMLLAAIELGMLPLRGGEARLGYVHILPLAALSAMGFALPLAIMTANWHHKPAILRFSLGKLIAAVAVLMLLPAAVTENGHPLMPAPLYLFVAGNSGELSAMIRASAFCLIGSLLLYPVTSALIWGLPRLWRIPALFALPVGLYAFVILAGGNI